MLVQVWLIVSEESEPFAIDVVDGNLIILVQSSHPILQTTIVKTHSQCLGISAHRQPLPPLQHHATDPAVSLLRRARSRDFL